MYRFYSRDDFLVLPEDLTSFAWSAPMRELAAKVGRSDVALRKYLRSHGVVPPPQGHWNKVKAGKSVSQPPAPDARKAGETGRRRVASWLKDWVPQAEPMPSTGPFASAAVPEDLDELLERERKAIGRVSVPKTLDAPHAGIRHIVQREERLRLKSLEPHYYNWDRRVFTSAVDQRRLRLLNGLFLALSKRGHDGSVHATDDGELSPYAAIGDTQLRLSLEIAGKHAKQMKYGRMVPDPALPATTPLKLSVTRRSGNLPDLSWQDSPEDRLEARIGDIAAELIVEGEAQFRRGLKIAEEIAEQQRIEREHKESVERDERERQRLARIAAINQKRIDDLHLSGKLLRDARDLRVLVAEVRSTMTQRTDISPDTLKNWETWALGEADKLDPIISGQIFDHLEPPENSQD